MNPVLIGIIVLVALVVYLIATHKIDITHLKSEFVNVKEQLGLVHNVASAPVSVVAVPVAVPVAAPAPDPVKTVTDAIAAAVAPAAAVNPFIAWKAAGKDLLWIQTMGLQRALSDAEWAQAIAAGYVKDSGPVATAEVARDFSAAVLDYAVVHNQDMVFTGPVGKTITGCPATVKVKTAACSGAVLKTPYWLTVNGVRSPPQDNPQATYAVDVAGPSVVVSIDQQPDSVIDLWIA